MTGVDCHAHADQRAVGKILMSLHIRKSHRRAMLSFMAIALVQCFVAKSICTLVHFANLWITLIVYCFVALIVSIVFDIIPFVMSDEFKYCKTLGVKLLGKLHKIN